MSTNCGAFDRQARSQARCDLEPARAGRQQRLHQGPGIEALRLDQPGRGPQPIIETAVLVDERAFTARPRWRHCHCPVTVDLTACPAQACTIPPRSGYTEKRRIRSALAE